jgi:hypothetical protein
MRGLRFSLAGLLLALAFVGVAIGVLNPATRLKAALLSVATVYLLLTAILLAANRTATTRTFWFGFALFGWFYFAVAFTSVFPSLRLKVEWPLYLVRDSLWANRVAAPESQLRLPKPGLHNFYDHDAGQIVTIPLWDEGFGDSIHCITAILFAATGGLIGHLLLRSRESGTSCAALTTPARQQTPSADQC